MSAQNGEETMARLQDDGEAVVERFQPTSGRFSGWAAVLLSAAVLVAMVAYLDDGFPAWVGGVALLVGVLSWAAMLRPALWVTEEHLVMRNLADTVRIRLAAVEELAVRQVLAVRAGDRRLVSTVLGRTWRKSMMSRRAASEIAITRVASFADGGAVVFIPIVARRSSVCGKRIQIRSSSVTTVATRGATSGVMFT